MESESEKNESKERIKAFLKDGDVFVSSHENTESLTSRGYGTQEDDSLKLAFYEALYLVYKGIIEIEDEKTNEKLAFQDLLERFRSKYEDAWTKYLVYRDLRSRGYVVREGFGLGIDFRVYERGEYGKSTADYLILCVKEGQPIPVENLARIIKQSQSMKKMLILSVLSRRGEIVYYSLSQLSMPRIE
ncbi:MAG: tRNA-intron lyase [Nitrososphaerota archaeon]|nr:tRNA-intron lyase [Candidatus Bathyarchaeota archaeon]MDW8049029.1 tRNA-intron lyase [Nitrososphaerota archaeon]